MNRTTNCRSVVAALIALALGVACNGILGIEKAEVDPTFRADSGLAESGVIDSGNVDSGAIASNALCERYCSTIMAACVGEHLQYLSKEVCLAMCPNFDVGADKAVEGNVLSCRITHADFARDKSPDVHCPHAGPLGAGTCGPPCEGFCLQTVSLCKSAYQGEADCKKVCSGYAYLAGADAGELQFTAGDSLNCRLFHLETAYTKGFETLHCPHTAKVSDQCRAPLDGGKD